MTHAKKKLGEDGMAMITVIILVMGVAAIAALMTTSMISEGHATDRFVYTMRATAAAEAGLELAARELWFDYYDSLERDDGSGGDMMDYLADMEAYLPADGQMHDLLEGAIELPNGARVESIQVERFSDMEGLLFNLRSAGTFHGVERVAIQSVRIAGSLFEGFGFALLARNVNCILCHADFDNIDRILNTDAEQRGSYDRVRIASLDSLLVRVGSADTTLAGTFYTRGIMTNKSGEPIDSLSGSGFSGYDFDAEGHITEDAGGAMTGAELETAELNEEGLFDPFEQVYTDYPLTDEGMTDGTLPAEFPPVIPDTNLNKLVDDDEFSGLVSALDLGGITGGVVYGLPQGDVYGEEHLPEASNEADVAVASGFFDGNLMLVGTAENPIQIDGKVAVDGDIIIKGPIEGRGQVFARNNIYFVGDTTYDDAPESFGEADDGSSNLAAYAAGGNILIGDYLTPKKMGSWVEDKKGKLKFKGIDADVFDDNYVSADAIDPGGPPNSGAESGFTMSELTLFNRKEYLLSEADPEYIPRYYQLRDGDPLYWFANDSKEHGGKYDGDFAVLAPPEDAAIVSLSPRNNWVSEIFLKQAWRDDEESRLETGQPFQIDGLIYTNNLVFALARSHDKHNSRTYGKLYIRGGLVAADVGILSAGDKDSGGRGFTLHYDDRVKDFLGIRSPADIGFTRMVRLFE